VGVSLCLYDSERGPGMTQVFRRYASKDGAAHEDILAMPFYGPEFQHPQDHDLVRCACQHSELVWAAVKRVFAEARSLETCSAVFGGRLLGSELGLRTCKEQP
jgi:hypothetical protein